MSRWREQCGAALVTMLWLFAVITLGLALLLDFYGIFVAKRTGRTAADAAALGALQAVEREATAEANRVVPIRVEAVRDAARAATERRVHDWAARRRADLADELSQVVPPLDPDEIERIVSSTVAAEEPEVRSTIWHDEVSSRVQDASLRRAVLYGTPAPLEPALRELFTAPERGCLIRRVAREKREGITAAASWFAQSNGADQEVQLQFPVDSEIKVRVVVRRSIPLVLTARWATTRLLDVEAVSRGTPPGGMAFDLNGAC